MIVQYRFSVKAEGEIDVSLGYPLYGWLMENAPYEFAEAVHEQGETPVAQHLQYRGEAAYDWVVTLIGADAVTALSPVLDTAKEIALHNITLSVILEEKNVITSAVSFIKQVHAQEHGNRLNLIFRSPTSFKQNGRHVLFPQESLILQSLITKWNIAFPEYPMDDADAFAMLENGVRIVDYRLRSLRYPMKATRITGFVGRVTLSARLSAPMQEIWNLLAAFAPYSGIGIKTALGMGGVSIEEL